LGRLKEAGEEAEKSLEYNPTYARGHEIKKAFLKKTFLKEWGRGGSENIFSS